MNNDLIPVPEHHPPYTADFIAHLHAGAYEHHPDHAELWYQVQADPAAAQILAALDQVTALLRTHTPNLLAPGSVGADERTIL